MISIVEFDFKQFFTSDASELISTYLTSLKNFMTREGFGNDQIEVVINGIIEFIQEYSLNFNNNKINFSTTLELIEEIGSPTEIIQSLDQKSKDTMLKICHYCQYKNIESALFCEFCGKNLSQPHDPHLTSRNKILKIIDRQEFIDHPISYSFIIISVLFALIIDLFISSSYISIPQYNYFVMFIFGFLVSLVLAVPPSAFLSVLVGFICDSKYSELKSIKFKSQQIIHNFEENFTLGTLTFVFGTMSLITLIYVAFFNEFSPPLVLLWGILIIIDLLIVRLFSHNSEKPTNLSLTELNKLKFIIEKENSKFLKSLNFKMIFPIMFLAFITLLPSMIIFQYNNQNNYMINFQPLMMSFFLIYMVSYYLIINGIYFVRLNSWKMIKEKAIQRNIFFSSK